MSFRESSAREHPLDKPANRKPEEILIVGGGVSGLSSALALLEAGRTVRLLERSRVGSGASHGNCGLITPSHALPLTQPGMLWQALKWMLSREAPVRIRPRLSPEFWRWGWRFSQACRAQRVPAISAARAAILQHSRSAYPGWLERHGVRCEWRAGGQILALASQRALEHEFGSHAELRALGIEVQALSGPEAAALEPALRPELAGAAHYPGDAQLRPESLVRGLALAVQAAGGEIEEGTTVDGLLREGSKVVGVRCGARELRAQQVVLAGGAWSPAVGRRLGLALPIEAARGYSITLPRPGNSPRNALILEEAAMGVTPWESGLRLGGCMEFCGWSHPPDPTRFEALRRGARRFLTLDLEGAAGEEWSGYRAMTPDELPLIGALGSAPNLYLATGHGRMGVAMAPSTGQLLRELLCGEPASLDPAPYSPDRFARLG